MAPVSSGRITKARKGKNATPHHKNHRWESFTTKISKLHSLDPLKKVRRHDLDAEDVSTTTSYFQNGLQRWSELTIAKDFVAFKRAALPMADSLPQILHFEKRIMQLFVQYISAQEKDSLEPLLDLLTAFARDLGPRFEKHYHQSLSLIIDIVGKPQDVEVIEWTFGALAFLFKRLYKLLVPDLRPTYDVISPLLGKSKHPPHIARFAAEAMSFLIKKAAAPNHRETALPLIMGHTKTDLYEVHGSRQFDLFQDGLMTMYAEAVKGPGDTIHSSGAVIFRALLDAVPDRDCNLSESPLWTNLACGVLTSLLHHSTMTTLEPVVQAICEYAKAVQDKPVSDDVKWPLVYLVRVLGTLSGVRKGSRVENWLPVIQNLTEILGTSSKAGYEVPEERVREFWHHVIVNTAIAWVHAPVNALTPSILSLTSTMAREPFRQWYIPFCAYIAELDSSRFRSLFLTNFQGFIVSNWSDEKNEDFLCVYLHRMAQSRAIQPVHGHGGFPLPREWQDHIVSKFERLEISPFPEGGAYGKDPQTWRDRCLPKYAAVLAVLESTSVHPSTDARIAELLLRKLKLALRPSTTLASDEVHFIVSQGFRAYLRMTTAAGSVDQSLIPLLEAAVPRFCRSVGFLEAFLSYKRHVGRKLSGQKGTAEKEPRVAADEDRVVSSLVGNLALPSHELRLLSLQILAELDQAKDESGPVDAMMEIEETPLEPSNSRKFGMHLRKLGQTYASLDAASWISKATPSFLFGMLTVKMAPVWDSAIEALQEVGQTRNGAEAIESLAFAWLSEASPRWTGPQQNSQTSSKTFVSDFECRNVQSLERTSWEIYGIVENPVDAMLKSFDEQQQTVDLHTAHARAQSLRVLAALPSIAEKRSRKFVPRFLEWAGSDDEETETSSSGGEDPTGAKGWSLSDRKGMLKVFGQFKNPTALFSHEKVYQALVGLMENGDIDLQRLVLKALLTWKQEGVKPYQENLENLLDEAKFKNEITALFQGDQGIRPEHRPQLMPILLRLLYGRTISKKGVASGRHGPQTIRLAVLRNLTVEDTGAFLDIATGRLKGIRVVDRSGVKTVEMDREVVSVRRQVGFLNMMASLISELGTSVSLYMDSLVHSVLYCLFFACRRLREVKDIDADPDAEVDQPSNLSLLKVIRASGLKCLIALFRNAPSFEWTPYANSIVEEVVSPRIERLPVESAQSVSGILQLLSTWSMLPRAALFLSINERVIPQVIDCLTVEKGKDDVKIFVLRVIGNLVKLAQAPADESEFNELIKAEILEPNTDKLLHNIAKLLETSTIGNFLLENCVETIIEVAPIVSGSENVRDLLEISTKFLIEPPRRINPKMKGRILLVLERFVGLQETVSTSDGQSALLDKVYESLANLFSYFKDRENRESLCRVLHVLASKDGSLQEVAGLCEDLNSYVRNRLDEPDANRRLGAFNRISKPRDRRFTPRQWLCLLHNLIFFIQDDEEFGVLSSNSADSLRQLIEDAASCQEIEMRSAFEEQLKSILLPAIYKGMRDPSEAIRREYLRVMAFLLSRMPEWPPVADMKALLGDTEENASEPPFFFHILSPATSRQMEAFQILAKANETAQMGSQNIGQFFIPLLENFIFGRADNSDDHGLSAQATTVIGDLAASLGWAHYRSILLRYCSYITSRPEHQKAVIRLLGRFTDAVVAVSGPRGEGMDLDESEDAAVPRKRLAETLPGQEKLSSDVTNNFLPTLIKHLHEKDESEVSYRVPAGVVVVKLLKLLPAQEMSLRLAPVLTDICHILRSKAVESRDMARDTLVKVALVLGSEYFYFILRELRGALRRGYQLHVLSYTLHSILLAVIPHFGQGSLDYCLPSIVSVIMDDIFGVTGQEKDAEGYTTQTKEIKSSKSQDSMELVSKTASIGRLIDLIKPLQGLLLQKVDLKMTRKIDSLLTRISIGLLQNPSAESQDTLVFCYEVIQEVYKTQKVIEEPKMDARTRRYLVQRGGKKSGERGVTSKHTYKLVCFAVDVLRSVLKKYDSLRTATYITGFIPVLGDALVDGEAEIKTAVFKLLNIIVKVPFPNDDIAGLYKVAVKEATKSIAMAPSTKSDLSQAALKLVSVALRDRNDVEVKEAAVDMLVRKLKDDLTDPQYRFVTFNFLRCVMDRKLETAAVYDVLDYAGTVMITNDDKETRDLARGCFFQFIRTYKQKKERWAKQLNFIVANLKYDREGGRLSVTEVIHLLLLKTEYDHVQEVAATCFLPIVMVVANDDSEKCRLAAGELVKQVFAKADREQTKKFLTLLRSWLGNEENQAVSMLALKIFGFYFDANEGELKNRKDLAMVLTRVMDIFDNRKIGELDADVVTTTLDVVRVLTRKFPAVVLAPVQEQLWQHVRRCMVHPNSAVRLNAVRLVADYLVDFAGKARETDEGTVMTNSHGMELTPHIIEDLVGLCIRILSTPVMSEELATESGQVLIFLGPNLPRPTADIPSHSEEDVDEDEGEEGADAETEAEKEEPTTKPRRKDLHFLLWKLSYILRRHTTPKSESINGKVSALNILETLCRRLPLDSFHGSIKLVLVPLHHLTDRFIPVPFSTDDIFKTKYDGLKTRAQIMMDALQKKLGTTEYSKLVLEIRGEVRKNREERSRKRKVGIVVDPERYGRDKRKKVERKKERRKEKGKEHRAMRQSFRG